MIAALYVDRRGQYFGRDGVDPWNETRDARKYAGPHPVVAHPPCQLWVNMAAVNFKRWGGEHNRPAWSGGSDGGCFASALASVRAYGGVLEHPAFSHAWEAHALTRPVGIGWQQTAASEWVCEVWQSAYGHKARKRTWLLYSGAQTPLELDWTRKPGTHHIGNCGGPTATKPTVTKAEAIHTPPSFADALITLAKWSKG